MTIEAANRLCAYRKHNGYSQEEIAEKVGVTRQAVSKWERAEASPDLDNLILLSDIYGVTLDQLLNTDPVMKEEPQEDSVNFKNGIHVHSKNGDKVDISFKGIHVEDKNGDSVHIGSGGINVPQHRHFFYNDKSQKFTQTWNRFPWPVVCVIVYLALGIFEILGGWAYSWVVFLTIPLYYSLGTAIAQRNGNLFAFPVLVTMAYLISGIYFKLWHPTWIIFMTIPFYYWLCNIIKQK